ncbi:MAG: hypothetical protein O2856_13000, partial [Planctomycetota bacterium]|nr:hypothetical protein [Planctomycetota bacterium]
MIRETTANAGDSEANPDEYNETTGPRQRTSDNASVTDRREVKSVAEHHRVDATRATIKIPPAGKESWR